MLLIAACGAVAASAFAVGTARLDNFFPRFNGHDKSSTLQPGKAALLFSTPSRGGRDATFWSVPNDAGQTCVAVRVVDHATGAAPAQAAPVFANGGVDCNLGGDTQPAGKIQVILSWEAADGSFGAPSDGNWATSLLGHLPAGSTAVSLVLRTSSGSTTLPLKKGYFAGLLPGTTSSLERLPGDGKFTVVALDAQGNELESLDLSRFVAQATP